MTSITTMDHPETNIDIDHFARIGPKSGVVLDPQDAHDFLSHLGQVTDIQASASGYNNRLYKVTVTAPDAQANTVSVVKAGGRSWKRVKTEAEVAGLAVAGAASESADPKPDRIVPVPRVLAWRSDGAQELVAIDHRPGIVLKALWPHLHSEHRLSAVTQLAHFVCQMKSNPAARALVAHGAIGNLTVRNGPVAHARGPPKLDDITLGRMVDGGLGPWFPSAATDPVLLQYIRDTTHAAVATLRSPGLDVLAGMRTRFAPRIDAFLAALDSIGSSTPSASSALLPTDLTTWSSVPLSVTHGDLNLQNILVTFDGITDSLPMSATDPFALDFDAAAQVLASLKFLDTAKHKLTITSILDWEWAGVFPWTDEFRASSDFLASPEAEAQALCAAFYNVLEAGGLPTPRKHDKEWAWLSGVCLVRETLAPWWMRDLVDPAAEEHGESKRVCEQELDEALTAVGF